MYICMYRLYFSHGNTGRLATAFSGHYVLLPLLGAAAATAVSQVCDSVRNTPSQEVL